MTTSTVVPFDMRRREIAETVYQALAGLAAIGLLALAVVRFANPSQSSDPVWGGAELAAAFVFLTVVLAVQRGRRRGLSVTNRGLAIRFGPFRRFKAPWGDIASIRVGEQAAVITLQNGRMQEVDLRELRNSASVRDALAKAEATRTAKRRFGRRPDPLPEDRGADAVPMRLSEAPRVSSDGPPPAAPRSPATPSRGPTLLQQPTVIQPAGNKPKRIEEYAGLVNSGHRAVSVARMVSPEGWIEPGQQPEFEEITVVLEGLLRVEHQGGVLDVRAGQAVVTHPGEWIRYSTPEPGGAEYVAVCLPAFSPDTVHRDDSAAREAGAAVLKPWPPVADD